MNIARTKTQQERARLASVEAVSFVMRPGQTGEFILRAKYTNADAAKASEGEVKDAMQNVGKADPLVMVILAALVSVDLDRDDDVLTLKATLHRALLDRLARE